VRFFADCPLSKLGVPLRIACFLSSQEGHVTAIVLEPTPSAAAI
jgi:hypothetical protein